MVNYARCSAGFIVVLYEWALNSAVRPILAAFLLLMVMEPFRHRAPAIYWSILGAVVVVWSLRHGDTIARFIRQWIPYGGNR